MPNHTVLRVFQTPPARRRELYQAMPNSPPGSTATEGESSLPSWVVKRAAGETARFSGVPLLYRMVEVQVMGKHLVIL